MATIGIINDGRVLLRAQKSSAGPLCVLCSKQPYHPQMIVLKRNGNVIETTIDYSCVRTEVNPARSDDKKNRVFFSSFFFVELKNEPGSLGEI